MSRVFAKLMRLGGFSRRTRRTTRIAQPRKRTVTKIARVYRAKHWFQGKTRKRVGYGKPNPFYRTGI